MLLSIFLLAAAPAPEPSGRQLYDDAQYADAIAAYDEFLAQRNISEHQRQEAWLYLGFSHLALRHEEAARRQFRLLLSAAPRYVLPPYTPPRFVAVFEQVRREVTAQSEIAAKGVRTEPSALGTKVELNFLVASTGAAQPILFYRFSGEEKFRSVALVAGAPGEASAKVDAPLGKESIEYYAELQDGGKVEASAGNEKAPLFSRWHATSQPPPAAVSTPVYKEWWLWTIVGVVAAGGAATAVYFVTRPSGTSGSVDLQLQGAR